MANLVYADTEDKLPLITASEEAMAPDIEECLAYLRRHNAMDLKEMLTGAEHQH